VTLETNKSIPKNIEGAGIHFPSYATATCDGLLGLNVLGRIGSDNFSDAKEWLLKHDDLTRVEGLTSDDPEQWSEIMHYYHLAVRAEAMNLIDQGGDWQKQVEFILEKEQQPEGFFINPIGGINKEDDPLMATILAVQALSEHWGD
jgi:hypothetical protein